jgi:hypothetical protein
MGWRNETHFVMSWFFYSKLESIWNMNPHGESAIWEKASDFMPHVLHSCSGTYQQQDACPFPLGNQSTGVLVTFCFTTCCLEKFEFSTLETIICAVKQANQPGLKIYWMHLFSCWKTGDLRGAFQEIDFLELPASPNGFKICLWTPE